MLQKIAIENCYVFSDKVEFSLEADMRNKRFGYNVKNAGKFNTLKSIGIYGQNNAGKTCLFTCIKDLKNILLGKKHQLQKNIFIKNNISSISIEFLDNEVKYKYSFKHDFSKSEFIYEKLSMIERDVHNNEKETTLLEKNFEDKIFKSFNKEIEKMAPYLAKDKILIHLIDSDQFPKFNDLKKILIAFAEKIEVINMTNIPLDKTIDKLKNNDSSVNKIKNLIINSDLYLDDYRYDESMPFFKGTSDQSPKEKVLNLPDKYADMFKLVSVYKGQQLPSFIFDSTGTKKIAALASYIIEALEQGKILFVDEIDSGIHSKLTRAIVSMFNNELNEKGQLIFTIHDTSLLDCKKLFRKKQIWFIHKDIERTYLYSLADFTADKDGIRDTSDISSMYKKGKLGAIPEPKLIKSLLEVSANE